MPDRPILPRGLIEVSNRCQRNCLYCGIRRDASVPRYHLTEAEVLAAIDEARRRGYPAVALQAGELKSEENTSFYEHILKNLGTGPAKTLGTGPAETLGTGPEILGTGPAKTLGTGPMEVTLSLGEQSEATYARWKAAAGSRILRYLLRIESSDPRLFAAIHPAGVSYARRLECIRSLKRLGYVTGSGVMIGLPGQTRAQLEADLEFFERERLDMVGMGPYIPVPGTPLAEMPGLPSAEERLELSLWMIREVRRRMPHVNIVAATAIEALAPGGRELALAAGANVIMPNLTPRQYREQYRLYPGKTECVR